MTKEEFIKKVRKEHFRFRISRFDIGWVFFFKLLYLIPVSLVCWLPMVIYAGSKEIGFIGLDGIVSRYKGNKKDYYECLEQIEKR